MKTIPLGGKAGRGLFTLVDDDVYEWASKMSWHLNGGYAEHAQSTGNGRTPLKFKLHHLIIRRRRGKEIDHINGNRLDNRRSNLRFVSKTQNQWNRQPYHWKSLIKLKGISKKRKRYYSRIQAKGKRSTDIGGFRTEGQAPLAYDLWAVDLFGEYARTNCCVVLHSNKKKPSLAA